MSARQQMAGLLDEWLRLTQAESAAIRAGVWPDVQRIQNAKAGLQAPMNEAFQSWAAEEPAWTAGAVCEHPFRAEVNRLIELESANAGLLAERQRQAQIERDTLNQAASNLRRVHRSYAQKPNQLWHSYS